MAPRVATIKGVALTPGVSKNGRLYTKEAIGRMAARAQDRIETGGLPLTMLTHHGAGDDSTKIVGGLTRVWQDDDGSARFEAQLADTAAAQQIGSLIKPANGGRSMLRNVSIRGWWASDPQTVQHTDGSMVETGDDLELDGLDFTRSPGVSGARIESADGQALESVTADGRALIREECQATIEADRKPYGDVPYADPGYQDDKVKRYPLDTKAHAKAAWGYINQDDNAKLYTAAQLKRIKGRIKAALAKFGVSVSAENRLVSALTEAGIRLGDLAECFGSDGQAGFSINAYNGPVTVTISAYNGLEPGDLPAVAHAAMCAAIDAICAMDPDLDADIDVPGAPGADTDGDADQLGAGAGGDRMETAAEPDGVAGEPAEPDTTTPAPDPVADAPTDQEEAAVSEPTTQAVETTPTATAAPAAPAPGSVTLTADQFNQLLAAFRPATAPTETAPATNPATETTAPAAAAPTAPAPATPTPASPAPAAETEEQRIERLVAERVEAEATRRVQEMVRAGRGPVRKGLVRPVNESAATGSPAGEGLTELGIPADWPQKPLHQYTAEERARYFAPALREHVLGDRT